MPPFVGVAVSVTLVPAQIVVDDVVIVTLGITAGVTVITIALEVAVGGMVQASLLVNVTV